MSRTAGPSRGELESLEEAELEQLAVEWRTRASRGAREAFGAAHALEAERRRRQSASRFAPLPPVPSALPRPAHCWWKFWQGLGGGSRSSTPSEPKP